MPGQHMRNRGFLCALLIATGMAADAAPADRYGCSMMLCEMTDAACDATQMSLVRRAGTGLWELTGPDRFRAVFTVLAPTGALSVALVSADIDPDASATGLMNIAQNGAALLTVQGYFPALSHVTYSGTCNAEAQ